MDINMSKLKAHFFEDVHPQKIDFMFTTIHVGILLALALLIVVSFT
jgi:hypothetical protein